MAIISSVPEPPLTQAQITRVDVLTEEFVVVFFSNGHAVTLESAKLKHLALTSGTEFSEA